MPAPAPAPTPAAPAVKRGPLGELIDVKPWENFPGTTSNEPHVQLLQILSSIDASLKALLAKP